LQVIQAAADAAEQKKQPKEASPVAASMQASSGDASEITLESLTTIGILGIGAFGSVSLVKSKAGDIFALKKLSKAHIIDTENEENVMREKQVMCMVDDWSVMGSVRTFKEPKYLYFLMGACLGGEVFARLRVAGEFDNTTARFYAACVVLALEHLNSLNIIYRDLKPENLLLDDKGFAKLIDFGCAKVLDETGQTFTLCGTPDYTAPELILGDGHGKAVDWWALGILIFEMLSGAPPFIKDDPEETYTAIVQLGQKCIDYPKTMSKVVIDIIRRLLLYNPEKRLGAPEVGGGESVRKHQWFKHIKWDKLEARELTPPLETGLDGPEDLRYFRLLPLEENNEWDTVEEEDFDFSRVEKWDPEF